MSPQQTRTDFAFEGFFLDGKGLWKAEYEGTALLTVRMEAWMESSRLGSGIFVRNGRQAPFDPSVCIFFWQKQG